MASEPDLVLASASPRRRELLERLGLVAARRSRRRRRDPRPGERPADYARRIAAAKCDVVADARDPASPLAVVGADTTVIVDDQILGKPADDADARAMLVRLAGRRHEVTTAYRVRHGGRSVERSVTTSVSFRALRAAEIDAYLASRRVARQGRRLRGPGHRGRVRDRAARLGHQRDRPARLRGARRPAGAGRPAPLPAAGVRGPGTAVTRAEEIADGLARGARPHRRRRAGGRPHARLGPPDRRQQEDDRRRRARGARRRAARLRRELRAGAARQAGRPRERDARARVALHRAAPEQQGQVRRRPGRAGARGRFDRRCSTRSRPAARPQACLVQVNVAGESRQARRRAGRRCPRCSIASPS